MSFRFATVGNRSLCTDVVVERCFSSLWRRHVGTDYDAQFAASTGRRSHGL